MMLFVYVATRAIVRLSSLRVRMNLFQQDIHTPECIQFLIDAGFKEHQNLQGIHLIPRWTCSLSISRHQEQLREPQTADTRAPGHARRTWLLAIHTGNGVSSREIRAVMSGTVSKKGMFESYPPPRTCEYDRIWKQGLCSSHQLRMRSSREDLSPVRWVS